MERLWEAEHSDQWDNLIVKCILDGYRKWGVWWEESIKKKKKTGEISVETVAVEVIRAWT